MKKEIITALFILTSLVAISPAFGEDGDPIKVIMTGSGTVYEIPILKKETTINDIKEIVAKKLNDERGTNFTAGDIQLAGPGNFVGKTGAPMIYKNDDIILTDEIHASNQAQIHVILKPTKK